MDARHFPLVEFETLPSATFDPVSSGYVWSYWRGRQTIDLRWVAAAKPWETDYTEVHLCGAGLSCGIVLRCDYSDFMKDWARAKGVP